VPRGANIKILLFISSCREGPSTGNPATPWEGHF
jgi:hypothetical protein